MEVASSRERFRRWAASRVRFSWLVVATGGLLCHLATGAEAQSVQSLLASGHAQFAAKNYRAGRAEYTKILQQTNALPFQRSVAQLRLAETWLREAHLSAAKAEFAKAAAMRGAPAHHLWEAEQQIQQISRRQKGLPQRDPTATRMPPPRLPAPGATFHVAPNGADANPGTKARSFATLERARDAVRALKDKSGLPPGGVAVVIHGGRYHVADTFRLRAEDSGTETAPIVYRAAPGKAPVFTGGARLFDNFVIDADPGFRGAARGLFQLPATAPALAQTSFQPIPFAEIGLYRDAFRKQLPAEAIAVLRSTGNPP